SSSTVHNIIKRFRESGEISSSKRQGRKPTLNARELRSLRRHCIKNQHHSVTDITTWVQEHFRKPLAHLRWTDAKWKSVLWSDESTFQFFFKSWTSCPSGQRGKGLSGLLSAQKVLKPVSLMVWGCVSAHGMGNLHICEDTINAIQLAHDNQSTLEAGTFPEFFQQDGAPPQYGCQVQAFLDEQFPGKWIGRRGPVEWPPRSPDLTPLDFYLWGHLKAIVYAVKIRDVQHLKLWILEASASISSAVLLSVCEEWEKRVALAIQHNGQHFEHIL
uniref:Transposase Tc1-like domain-containing protein n=1 Tax=Pygocentrus nattereri TaxID=42514 RepID=A0AAR2K5X1_PYGNA